MEWIVGIATIVATFIAIIELWRKMRGPKPLPLRPDEALAWQATLAKNAPAAIEDFLQQWSSGPLASEARDRLAKLTEGMVKVMRREVTADGDQIVRVDNRVWLKPMQSFADDLAPDAKGPEMVIIRSGKFEMGSSGAAENGSEAAAHERPARVVEIGHPFAVSKNLITFNDWELCSKATSTPTPDDKGWGRGRRPVIRISWDRAQEYTRWLSAMTGQRYRLLSEAEWEYCCRAGTDTEFCTGDMLNTRQARFDSDRTKPVGTYPPNAFGLHDMHGNLAEWCEDAWHESYDGAPTDGSAWLAGGELYRVTRGGEWKDTEPRKLRSRARWRLPPNTLSSRVGFRVARDLASK